MLLVHLTKALNTSISVEVVFCMYYARKRENYVSNDCSFDFTLRCKIIYKTTIYCMEQYCLIRHIRKL